MNATSKALKLGELLQQATQARDANQYRDQGARAYLITLPLWVAMPATEQTGKKAGAKHNLLPFHVQWFTQQGEKALHVQPIADSNPRDFTWQVLGPGVNQTGTCTIAYTYQDTLEITGQLPDGLENTCFKVDNLRNVIQQGEVAKWELTLMLGDWARGCVEQAHRNVTRELAGKDYGHHLITLDDIQLEKIVDLLSFGDPERGGHIPRLVERMIKDTHRWAKVDPQRYALVTLRRDSEALIRQTLGDLAIGPKVRRMWRKQAYSTLEELVEAYREVYPADRLGLGRAQKCIDVPLSVRKTDVLIPCHDYTNILAG